MTQEPRSGHELTVFVVPAHLGDRAAGAVDDVVARTRGVNAAYAWLVVDSRVRALQPPVAEVRGALLAGHCVTRPRAPADLTEGLLMAVGLAQQFVDDHDDGLPLAVDLLAVADTRCRLDASASAELPTDGTVQAGIVLHDYPDPVGLPTGLRCLYAESLVPLGMLWTLLRSRHRVFRRPAALLG